MHSRLRAARLLSLASVSLFLLACGSSDDGPRVEGGGGEGPGKGGETRDDTLEVVQCTRNLEFLEAERSCIRDGDCACGAHCEFQQCTYSCLADDDCEGDDVCSDFGRCEAEGAARLKHRVSNASGLEADRDFVSLTDAEAATIQVRRRFGDADDLLVRASPGAEVSCGDEFGESCILALVGDEEVPIWVRAVEGAAEPAAHVRVIPRVGIPLTIDLQLATSLISAGSWDSLDDGAVYRGVARLSSLGLTGLGSLAAELQEVPVEIELYRGAQGQARLFRLSDPTHAFSDEDGEMAGALNLINAGTIEARFRSYLFAGDESPTAQSVQLVAQPRAQVDWWTDTSVRMSLELELDGLDANRRPTIGWELELTRVATRPTSDAPTFGQSFQATQGQINADKKDPLEASAPAGGDYLSRAQQAACGEGVLLNTGGVPFSDNVPDLACAGASPSRGFLFNYVARADEAVGSPDAAATLEAMLSACEADLAQLQGSSAGSGECLELSRALTVMGQLAEGSLEADTWQGETLYKRSVQRWLELYVFVVNGALQEQALKNALEQKSERSTGRREWQQLVDPMLSRLLVPRLGVALSRLSVQAVTSNEYGITSSGAKVEAGDEALAVTLLGALATQLQLQDETLVENMRLSGGAQEVPAAVGETLRRALALAAYAGGWSGAAIEQDESWNSDSQLRGAFSRFSRSYGKVLGRVADFEAGRDEFGLLPGEVPLYLDTSKSNGRQRAFAVSDYLQGSTDWLGAAIARLDDEFLDARNDWLEQREVAHQAEISDNAITARVAALIRELDEPLQALCPHTPPQNTGGAETRVADAMATWKAIDPRTCMISDAEKCEAIPSPSSAWQAPISALEVERHICMGTYLRKHAECRESHASSGQACPEASEFGAAEEFSQNALLDGKWNLEVSEVGDGLFALSVGGKSETYDVDTIFSWKAAPGLSDDRDATKFDAEDLSNDENVRRAKDASVDAQGALRISRAHTDAQSFCDQAIGKPADESVLMATVPAADDPECYQGALGEAVLAARSGRLKVSEAKARLDEHLEAYQVAMQKCLLVSNRDAQLVEAESEFLDDTEELRAMSALFGGISNALMGGGAAATGYLDRKAKSTAFPKFGEAVDKQSVHRKRSFAASGFGVAFGIAASVMDAEIKRQEREYEAKVDQLEREFEADECNRQAKRELIGMGSANAEIKRAGVDWAGQLAKLGNLKQEMIRLVSQAPAIVQDELSFGVQPLGPSPWRTADAGRFAEAQRFARRMAHLSVLAAEYEQQETLGSLRMQVAAALSPSDFEEIQADLAAQSATGRIHGSEPQNTVRVVSLRDEIIATADYSEVRDGEHALNYEETFVGFLTDPRFSQFDEGKYLGQLIPFELLAPSEQVLGLGANGFSNNNCAERLWSVAAAVMSQQGEDANPGTTQTELHVLKRNTFYSSGCTSDEFQEASFEPSRNLFLDPEVTGTVSFEAEPPNPYTRLVLNNTATQATRSDLEASNYDQGVQTGLAARGLFGEYALFIPAGQFEVCDEEGDCSANEGEGLDLSVVRDILIRFEYTAAVK